ncbi:hypothetical protein EK904_014329 [Melospiza melodia maxima]|nr:hypothetical protein EK904_014329 [Melospiza melodia maxima]
MHLEEIAHLLMKLGKSCCLHKDIHVAERGCEITFPLYHGSECPYVHHRGAPFALPFMAFMQDATSFSGSEEGMWTETGMKVEEPPDMSMKGHRGQGGPGGCALSTPCCQQHWVEPDHHRGAGGSERFGTNTSGSQARDSLSDGGRKRLAGPLGWHSRLSQGISLKLSLCTMSSILRDQGRGMVWSQFNMLIGPIFALCWPNS